MPKFEKCPRCSRVCPLHPFTFPTGESFRLCGYCCESLYKKFKKAKKEKPEELPSIERRKRIKRSAVGMNLVRMMFEDQRGRCVFCKVEMDEFHVDHIIPLARGGGNEPDNLQLLCPKCNLSKKDKDPAKFMMESGIISKKDIFVLSAAHKG